MYTSLASDAQLSANVLEDFLQRVDIRAAQFVSFTVRMAVRKRADKGGRHVLNIDGGKTRVQLWHWQNRTELQECGESVDERVFRTEDDRWAHDRVSDLLTAEILDDLFCLPLAAQIVAGPSLRIGFECTHLD